MKIVIYIAKCLCIALLVISCLSISTLAQSDNLSQLVEMVKPSIVVIITYDKNGKAIGQGTGFFIKNGHVITNYHVIAIEGNKEAIVKLSNGKIFSVQDIIADDKDTDLIELSLDIPIDMVYPLVINDIPPKVGQKIVVIGNPLGLEMSVSDGIIAAIREDSDLGSTIQVTAPISPGSSGSPVVNLKGEVVGVISFLIKGGQNLNFAIPGNKIIALGQKGLSDDYLFASVGQILGTQNTKDTKTPIELLFTKQTIEDTKSLVEYGNKLFAEGKYKEAIAAYKQAIKLDPNNSNIVYNLGNAYSNLERYQEALEAFKQAIKLDPNSADAFRNLGSTYERLGRYQEAIEALKQAIKLDPNSSHLFYGLGLMYGQLKRYQEAIEAYKQAIKLDPNSSDAFCQLGRTYGGLRRYEEAIDAFKQTIKITPNNGYAHWLLGMTYLNIGNKSMAFEEYKILKELDPTQANQLFDFIYKD